tara:strand:+ start:708 stop:1274 length:567 start_codon:yes stop_codon:yes gene_type:complete
MKKFSYWHWNNLISKERILEINQLIEKKYNFIEGEEKAAKDSNGKNKKNSLVKIITYERIKPLIYDVVDEFMHCGRFNFGYDIFDLSYSDPLNLNIYSSKHKAKYDWHTDGHEHPKIDTKLSVLINISLKKYEGGKLHFFDNNKFEVPHLNTPGNAVMFKSATNHMVTPVTKGERRTLAMFIYGPAFR